MKKLLFFISFCVSLTISASLYAQDRVPLRSGVHDGYTRLVFGWSEVVTYSLDRSSNGMLTMRFNNEGKLDQSGAQLSDLKTIGEFDVLSVKPLTVRLKIPKSSKIRHLKIGKRVVLDIYDPDNPDDLKGLKPVKQVKSQEPPSPKKAAPVKKEEPKVAKVEEKKTKKPPAAPPAFVLVPENLPVEKPLQEKKQEAEIKKPDPEEIATQKSLSKAVEQKEHVITLRGTQAMTVAVYESFDALWMVVSGGNSFAQPNLTSPDPNLFADIQTVQNDIIDVYRLNMPDEPLSVKGIGGALAWDVVLGDKVKKGDPVKLQRVVHNIDGLRGGSIFWPVENMGEIVEIEEPATGETLIAVTVENATQLAGDEQHFVDFDVLSSPIGLVIRPKVDDLEVKKVDGGVEISRPLGLALSLSKDIDAAELFTRQRKIRDKKKSGQKQDVIFKFDEWQLGNHKTLKHRENILLAGIHGQSESRRVQDLLNLGKMFLAHSRGAESLGYFNFASSELPSLEDSAEFRAYRGVAKAMGWKSADALDDLLFPALDSSQEIDLWKAFVLADLGDWQQAAGLLPEKYAVLYTYPYSIASRLAVVLAEVNLRAGNVKAADELMTYVDTKKERELSEPMKAALQYLRGESFRQKNDADQTKTIWKELENNDDDLYRTKAGLALTMLLANENKIDNTQKIDRLERLRYAWRGDGLEAQVNYWLGDAYFQAKDYIKGLTIMRQAASIAKETVLAGRITSDMSRTFNEMFQEKNLKNVSPLDAVAVFDQFKELTPPGSEGDKLVQRLAEHLVRSDLLGRASSLLRHQVDHRLKGQERLRIAIRLAAIELLDKNPQRAIDALGKASDTLNFLSESDEKEQRKHEINLLRIRAYAQNKEYNKALRLLDALPLDKMVNRLKADIAWQADFWDIAADALNDVLIDENISMTEKLSPEQVDIILRRAIALNLDNDRISLANMREKYSALMLESDKNKARQFEVITRPRRTALLDNREALKSAVSEVDLFKDFLESYRDAQN